MRSYTINCTSSNNTLIKGVFMKEIWEQCEEVQENISREEKSCLLLNISLGAVLSLLISVIGLMVLNHLYGGPTLFYLWIGMMAGCFIICLSHVHKDYQTKIRNVFNRACLVNEIFLNNGHDTADCRTFSDSTYYFYNSILCETVLGNIHSDICGKVLRASEHIKNPVTIQVNTVTKVPSVVTITNGNITAYFDAQEIRGNMIYNLIDTSKKNLLLMCRHEGNVFLTVNNDSTQLSELDKESIARELYSPEF